MSRVVPQSVYLPGEHGTPGRNSPAAHVKESHSMAAAEGIGPYLEQVLDNQDVQDNLRRAAARAEQAYARARGRKDAKQALKDQGVRRRAAQSVVAARDAVLAIRRGPEIQRR